MAWEIRRGDCIEQMRQLDPESIDAVVCDPPYGLEFMGKEWDSLDTRQPDDPTFHRSGVGPFDRAKVRYSSAPSYGGTQGFAQQEWHYAWATEALRVLKPGGHLLAFGGTRTYHRLACAIEDAGFEIRDSLMWLYGSGFPKSLDVSKAIDKAAGAEREVVGPRRWDGRDPNGTALGRMNDDAWEAKPDAEIGVTAPATPEAAAWEGWGTALKPAYEPIVMARKSLTGTVAANVLEHGTGAINVDGCRIDFADDADEQETKKRNRHGDFDSKPRNLGDGIYGVDARTGSERGGNYDAPGRWPSNVVLDPEAGELLDEQSGDRSAGNHPARRSGREDEKVYGPGWAAGTEGERRPTDVGGASRFFYCAKTSKAERGPGNHHPTVKPITLMRWLCRMVTPPGGTVLDPFTGSGSTGCAAVLEGFDFIGCEREQEYVEIAEKRIGFWAQHTGADDLDAVLHSEAAAQARRDEGQLDLLGDAA